MTPDSPLPLSTVDAENPWLGLASFTEETRSFFHGRDDDAAELARRVQRKLLTVLFGQSGHGKTSLLRAGLVPRLRVEGYCPVYVRLDYTPGAPTPAEQIKEAIFRATKVAGQWTQTGSSVVGESLWEFLHHRDDVLQDSEGRPLVPLLIFDQFEEIFTLAQADDAGRQRAQTFLADLSDLVENRPPADLEARIDRDEADAAKFDFARADYRILISLREDYLAHLEGLKNEMPSVTQNRVRLARFSGAQAIAAVRGPAPQLVTEEVAAKIVRFVSGGTDLARAEVEPSLLSLVCRELNNTRVTRGQAAITADLLEGSRDTILQEFYERALGDQPMGVRRFIEDEMLTDSGYRESVAEERVKKAFAAAGAPPDALAVLVGRRLLRVEERLDVRRVELTHDVLAGVVVASRAVRREREAKDTAEAQLRATQDKEAAAQHALWRARRVALVCGVLAIGAAGSAVFGYFSSRRASAAEKEALQAASVARDASKQMAATQELAQDARTEAEKLVSYLLDDFYNELEPVGRLDIVGELAKRAVAYYRTLPIDLRTPTTVRNQALALSRYGAVLGAQGKSDDATPMLEEALRTFDRLKSNGDHSDELTVGLGFAWRNLSRLQNGQGRSEEALESALQGLAAVRPSAKIAGAAVAVRREYAETLNRVGFAHLRSGHDAECIATFGECREVLAGLGAQDGSDLQAASLYASGAPWVMEAALNLGKLEEADEVSKESLVLSALVLKKNPADQRALRTQALVHGYSAGVMVSRMQTKEALEASEQGERDYEKLLQLDPTNIISRNNLVAVRGRTIQLLVSEGRVSEAVAKANQTFAENKATEVVGTVAGSLFYGSLGSAKLEAEQGNTKQAEAFVAQSRPYETAMLRDTAKEGWQRDRAADATTDALAWIALLSGKTQEAYDWWTTTLAHMKSAQPKSDAAKLALTYGIRDIQGSIARSALLLARYAEAEANAREAVASWNLQGAKALEDRRVLGTHQTLLAIAIARQGRLDEARALIEPVVAFGRELKAKGHEPTQHFELAEALYALALSQPANAAAARETTLKEAAALMANLPSELRNFRSAQTLINAIARAQSPAAN